MCIIVVDKRVYGGDVIETNIFARMANPERRDPLAILKEGFLEKTKCNKLSQLISGGKKVSIASYRVSAKDVRQSPRVPLPRRKPMSISNVLMVLIG